MGQLMVVLHAELLPECGYLMGISGHRYLHFHILLSQLTQNSGILILLQIGKVVAFPEIGVSAVPHLVVDNSPIQPLRCADLPAIGKKGFVIQNDQGAEISRPSCVS